MCKLLAATLAGIACWAGAEASLPVVVAGSNGVNGTWPASSDYVKGNCEKASYLFCCDVGDPCDCSKGPTAAGQCKQASYLFCCAVGTPCDCSQPPRTEVCVLPPVHPKPLLALPPPPQFEEHAALVVPAGPSLGNGMLVTVESMTGNCKKASYLYCCDVGTPCDCSKGPTAPGQCTQASYTFCCIVGSPCDCSQPPLAQVLGGRMQPTRLPALPLLQEEGSASAVRAGHAGNTNTSAVGHPRGCKKAAYLLCCVGTLCDCSKGVTAPGQCEQAAFTLCCSVGPACDCSQPPESEDNMCAMPPVPPQPLLARPARQRLAKPATAVWAGASVDISPPSVNGSHPENCQKAAFVYCCDVGKPCDCSKGPTATEQCEQASYLYCCGLGTPCDCSKPPMEVGAEARGAVVLVV